MSFEFMSSEPDFSKLNFSDVIYVPAQRKHIPEMVELYAQNNPDKNSPSTLSNKSNALNVEYFTRDDSMVVALLKGQVLGYTLDTTPHDKKTFKHETCISKELSEDKAQLITMKIQAFAEEKSAKLAKLRKDEEIAARFAAKKTIRIQERAQKSKIKYPFK